MPMIDELILTAPMLKQLRASEAWITLRASWEGDTLIASQIIGKRRDAEDNDYTNVVIDLPSWLEYGGGLVREYGNLNAYASVSSPRFHELWQTFLALARPGDDLRIVWSANGHANTNVRNAGLNVDTCELEIRRRGRRLRFHVDQRISPSNTARMFTAGKDGTYVPVVGPNADL